MPTSIRIRRLDSGVTPETGLIDTSVAVALDTIELSRLPKVAAISTLTLAELTSGPHGTSDPVERARRQEHVQQIESKIESLPFEEVCARAFGRIYAAVVAAGRKPRGPRSLDLMIAATALAYRLPLYTLNASDLKGLDDLIEIVDLS
jgi:predicted nucleic acid-binding protein